MAELVDTHCHIHASKNDRTDYTAKKWQESEGTDPDQMVESAKSEGVTQLICVGTDLSDSRDAVEFVQSRDNCWASVGAHPHDAKDMREADYPEMARLLEENMGKKIVAVGETGLDYYYEHSPKAEQIKLLEFQLDLARKHDLPVIFHVREAYQDFWPIVDNFPDLRGVVHSFSATRADLDQVLSRGLYVGLNGIMTFTSDAEQLEAAKIVPLSKLLLETDAPYLTPKPHRGKICRPEHVKLTAIFLSGLLNEDFEQFATQTTQNAQDLFKLLS